jgi:hypothetical protein
MLTKKMLRLTKKTETSKRKIDLLKIVFGVTRVVKAARVVKNMKT